MKLRRWSIDAPAGSITFVATSSVHPIRTNGKASGWFEAAFDDDGFVPTHPLHGRLDVPLDDLSSGNRLIDREMNRRVDTTTHPRIVAEIETTEDTGGNTAKITGTVRFLDAEVLVEGELNLLPGPRLSGTGEFDVRWWGLEPPRLLMLRVDPIVTVEIDLPLI
ncbi:MAG: YceI family protein [Actinomycetota bacterium]|nr:YceI family protein [Actinomycetota bacterium]